MRNAILALLIIGICSAGYEAAYDSNLSAVMVKVYGQMDINGSYEDFLSRHTLVVLGSDMDLGERALLETVRAENGWFSKARQSNDSNGTLPGIEAGDYSLVVLIGGPAQNNITKVANKSAWFNETYKVEGGFFVETGRLGNTLVLSISSRKGYDERPNAGVALSPLNAFMPKEFVPLAATGISVFALAIISLVRTVFEFKALDIGRKGKKVGEGAAYYRGINLTEAGAVVGASVILGVSISWQYFGTDFLKWIAINSIICLFAAIMHELTHRAFAYAFKLKIEYRFWPAGSVLTLISSYLGNAFSIQGFLLEDIEPDVPRWKVGLMKLSAPLVSTAIMVIFALLNYESPSLIYQTIYSTSGLWAMAEILPFGGLDGKDIKDWSHTVWFLAFTVISGCYVAVTFLL
ncbi:MAG TPA: hypothetical protein VLD37_07255 [Candidatus Bilamarchaeum sp.]|nr:hypothetical protein [Candidatus Bilamarchaeum sp.]